MQNASKFKSSPLLDKDASETRDNSFHEHKNLNPPLTNHKESSVET